MDREDESINDLIGCAYCGKEMYGHFRAAKHYFTEHSFIGWFVGDK